MKKNKRLKWIIPAVLIVALAAVFFWYVNDYYRSGSSAEACLESDGKVEVIKTKEGYFFDGVGEEKAFIFYPGAKVEYTAYAPLLHCLAGEGVDCFLVKMPANLAIFGQNKADGILKEYDYTEWYIGGHSLGGAMAASYVSGHLEEFDGLVLLAAYPTKSLKAEGFSVLSVYGSEDRVLGMEKLEEGRELMPEDETKLCIEGGNHAWFGNYGQQKGDGEAKIEREEQQRQTVEAILEMTER